MFRKISGNRAQTTMEYAILIGIIVAGLIAMQVYLKRGFQGKIKESADTMGNQFSPGYTTTDYTTHNATNSTETFSGGVTQTTINAQTLDRAGTEKVDKAENEYWWK